MEKPFIFIECKMGWREEFRVTKGHQPTYALLFLKEGSFRLTIDGKETIVQKNDCAIFSDDLDFFRTVIDPIYFVYLKFRVNPKCPFRLQIPLGKVHFHDKNRFFDSIHKYEALMEAEDARAVYYREHLLEDILLQAFAENYQTPVIGSQFGQFELQNCHDEMVLQAATYILKNLSKKLYIKDVCQFVSTNPSTLNFKFQKELSCSVGDFITRARMQTARRLLRDTTYSIGKIASRSGFDNIYYFSAVFRKWHDSSPSEFRKQYR